LGCNTFVYESNARNLSVYLSLTQLAKTLWLPYYAYVFSPTKLEIRVEQVLPGSGGGGGGGEQGGETTQTMYGHVNKWIIKNWNNKKKYKCPKIHEGTNAQHPWA
jgi:hypothetical protein